MYDQPHQKKYFKKQNKKTPTKNKNQNPIKQTNQPTQTIFLHLSGISCNLFCACCLFSCHWLPLSFASSASPSCPCQHLYIRSPMSFLFARLSHPTSLRPSFCARYSKPLITQTFTGLTLVCSSLSCAASSEMDPVLQTCLTRAVQRGITSSLDLLAMPDTNALGLLAANFKESQNGWKGFLFLWDGKGICHSSITFKE